MVAHCFLNWYIITSHYSDVMSIVRCSMPHCCIQAWSLKVEQISASFAGILGFLFHNFFSVSSPPVCFHYLGFLNVITTTNYWLFKSYELKIKYVNSYVSKSLGLQEDEGSIILQDCSEWKISFHLFCFLILPISHFVIGALRSKPQKKTISSSFKTWSLSKHKTSLTCRKSS